MKKLLLTFLIITSSVYSLKSQATDLRQPVHANVVNEWNQRNLEKIRQRNINIKDTPMIYSQKDEREIGKARFQSIFELANEAAIDAEFCINTCCEHAPLDLVKANYLLNRARICNGILFRPTLVTEFHERLEKIEQLNITINQLAQIINDNKQHFWTCFIVCKPQNYSNFLYIEYKFQSYIYSGIQHIFVDFQSLYGDFYRTFQIVKAS